MVQTDERISAIAAEAGFADQAHLTRSFKRVTGSTPAAYRRSRASGRSSNVSATWRAGRGPVCAPGGRAPTGRHAMSRPATAIGRAVRIQSLRTK
ncbi:MAG: helix-turn-helix domain-containing protein [Gemmatimonadales bacterium]